MKNKKILGFTVLVSIFILLTETMALVSKEVEAESIICPATITIGIIEGGKLKEIKTLTFEEYIC
jgi:hypothetical protein